MVVFKLTFNNGKEKKGTKICPGMQNGSAAYYMFHLAMLTPCHNNKVSGTYTMEEKEILSNSFQKPNYPILQKRNTPTSSTPPPAAPVQGGGNDGGERVRQGDEDGDQRGRERRGRGRRAQTRAAGTLNIKGGGRGINKRNIIVDPTH